MIIVFELGKNTHIYIYIYIIKTEQYNHEEDFVKIHRNILDFRVNVRIHVSNS